tara:strand:+ start:8 stop:199 length:192 start_codon:yes stop_codon:yes gene_type:complete
MSIKEPFISDIIKILSDDVDYESQLQSLKLYILDNKDYFKQFINGADVTWLTKVIYSLIKNKH